MRTLAYDITLVLFLLGIVVSLAVICGLMVGLL